MRLKYILTVKFLFFSFFLFSQEQMSIDKQIDIFFGKYLGKFSEVIFSSIAITEEIKIPWVLMLLLIGAVSFTIYFRFVNIRHFFTALKVVRGDYDALDSGYHKAVSDKVHSVDGDNPDTIRVEGHTGEVSHFQALTAALSATVGLGNIAGVAIALSIGGPGATFWMIVAGLLGMSSKFVECTLGVKYREISEKGVVYGGPMYYLRNGVGGNFGKILALFFAVMCIAGSFGGGNMFQVNQAFSMVEYMTGGEESILHGKGFLFGIVVALLVGVVIIGGIKSIARVTDKLIPTMVVIYVLAALVVLFVNYQQIPSAIISIIDGAFSPLGIAGGFTGVMIQGFKRAAFSNEAGIGSAAIAHSAVKTNYAASEGLVSLLEPFIDTVVICTMTALVLVVSGQLVVGGEMSSEQGVVLTSNALASAISWFPWVLMISINLFAFSTMISWSYYGVQAWAYIFGKSKTSEGIYKLIFCLFVVLGAAVSMEAVIGFSDAAIFAMMIPNMIGMFLLAPKVKKELELYIQAIKAK